MGWELGEWRGGGWMWGWTWRLGLVGAFHGTWGEMGGILGVSNFTSYSFWDGFLFWVESRWEDLYLKGRLNGWARARIWVERWHQMGGILGVSRMMRQSFWDGFVLLLGCRWEDLYLKGRLNGWARARIWVGRWYRMGGILGVSLLMRQSFWDGFLFWVESRWEDLYLKGRLNGWARTRIWVGRWGEMGGILGVSRMRRQSFWDGFLFWVESRWEDLYCETTQWVWARTRIWNHPWCEMGGMIGAT